MSRELAAPLHCTDSRRCDLEHPGDFGREHVCLLHASCYDSAQAIDERLQEDSQLRVRRQNELHVSFRKETRAVRRSEARTAGAPADAVKDLFPEDRQPGGGIGMMRVDNVWVTAQLSPEWQACYRIVAQGNRPVVGEVRIIPIEGAYRMRAGSWSGELLGARASVPTGGLTATTMRLARLGDDLFSGKHHLDPNWEVADRRKPQEKRSEIWQMLREIGIEELDAPRAETGGRSGKSQVHFARVAQTVSAFAAAGSKRANVDAAKKLGMTPTKVRDAIHRARRLGILPKTEQGRFVGGLTAFGRSLLGQK